MKIDRRTSIVLAALIVAAWLLLWLGRREQPQARATEPAAPSAAGSQPSQAGPAAAAPHDVAPAPPTAPTDGPAAAPSVPVGARPRSELPASSTHAKSRVWVKSTFGKRTDQLDERRVDGETYVPQGFVATADGHLVVLDTAKQRLVRYDQQGKLEHVIALPTDTIKVPADVAIAADGTIAVIDYPGLQTHGTVLLDPDGKKKGVLPQLPDTLAGLYAAGNDFYVDTDGLSTVKLGNTQGVPDADTQLVHQEDDGRIAGRVAPDGKTVLSFNFDDPQLGELSVSAVRGSPPQNVFTHFYRFPGVTTVPFLQADATGRIYMVINKPGELALVCLDGETGEPVGFAEIPWTRGRGGTQLRMFNVAPQGGLIYAGVEDDDITYTMLTCHP